MNQIPYYNNRNNLNYSNNLNTNLTNGNAGNYFADYDWNKFLKNSGSLPNSNAVAGPAAPRITRNAPAAPVQTIPNISPQDSFNAALNSLRNLLPGSEYPTATASPYQYQPANVALGPSSAVRPANMQYRSTDFSQYGITMPSAEELSRGMQQTELANKEWQKQQEKAEKQKRQAIEDEIDQYVKKRLQDEQDLKDFNEAMDYKPTDEDKKWYEAKNRADDYRFIMKYKDMGYDYEYLQQEIKKQKNTQDFFKAAKNTGLTVGAVLAPLWATARPDRRTAAIVSFLVPKIVTYLAQKELQKALGRATLFQIAPYANDKALSILIQKAIDLYNNAKGD